VFAAVLSWALVGAVRRYALARSVLDEPNHRSSHTTPTPRGGGIGVVLAFFAAVLAAGVGTGDWRLTTALVAVIPTAVIGWMDDLRSRGIGARITMHVMSGVLILPLALQATNVGRALVPLAAAWWIFATFSAINVVNFMDGIDGIIALQAIVFGLHVALVGGVHGTTGVVGIALAGSAAGFLIWNRPRARVFLGDVGSGALGVIGVIGGLMVLRDTNVGILAAFLPLVPLFLDASTTLVRRARRGERLSEAHRSHLYQRLANGGWGHGAVSCAYALAAALGSAVVIVAPATTRTVAALLYCVAIAATGVYLDRLRPLHAAA
jgi:Fuc2NAc and GlcNAc transferase